jgi:aspartate aminotransferase-like enzyme
MLWIPGPTEVRPELLAECARPMIGHRSQDCIDLIERLDPGLRFAFGLKEDSDALVAAHTCSATGLMEAALRGVGPKVLAVVGGAFAKRWREIAVSLGKQVVVLDVEWGRVVAADDLRRALAEHGPFDAVTLVSNETSTGARTPLDRVAEVLVEFPGVHLLVDLVSYLAGAPIDFDTNRIDFGLAGVQKALALPPGLSVCCASARYMESARSQHNRGFYLDPVSFIEGHVKRATPSTPALSLYYALARQLEDITAGTTLPERDRGATGAAAWEARYAKHQRMQSATVAWGKTHGLELLSPPEEASPTVSCMRAGGLDVGEFVARLKRKGHEIGNGYGPLKGKTFRIGHMGDHTEVCLESLLRAMSEVLLELS